MAGAAIDPLAGARAPPMRERAAVEWLGGGAPSPRALVPPASRTASGCLLLWCAPGEQRRSSVPHTGSQWWRMDEVSHASPFL